MNNYFPWWAKPCDECSNGLLMPDCSLWCSLTMKVAKGRCEEYSYGRPKLYKKEHYEVKKQQKAVKVKVAKEKPKIINSKKPISSKKTKPGQTRLF